MKTTVLSIFVTATLTLTNFQMMRSPESNVISGDMGVEERIENNSVPEECVDENGNKYPCPQ